MYLTITSSPTRPGNLNAEVSAIRRTIHLASTRRHRRVGHKFDTT